MPDGQNLLVSRQHNGAIFSIWRHALKSSSNPERLAEGGVDAIIPATGRHTRRIAWVHQIRDLNIYRIAASGTGKPTRLIASTPARSGRGVRSGRSHCLDQRSFPRTQIRIARGGGSNQTQVTSINGPQIDRLRWSFDGRYLAFESRPTGYSDIFVCGMPGRNPAMPNPEGAEQDLSSGQLTQITRSEGTWPSESADGKWPVFRRPTR